MAKEIGQLNVKIGFDFTGFQNGISSLNRERRKVQSEFKLASAEMGKHGKELDGLKLKFDSLTKQTELQRQKVAALEAAHQKSVETKVKDAKDTQDLEIRLNKAKTQLTYMEQDLKKLPQLCICSISITKKQRKLNVTRYGYRTLAWEPVHRLLSLFLQKLTVRTGVSGI